ncbi:MULTISPECIES: SDR family NAD(P)-dependent oxidoreductase [unclassified Beijerinckia]|uniref:SDR family NAD(P)-dependent oxidoreductase n=1 Tax=unclassified Beijerinckia TaxID=2638183 RepID=UPI00089B3F80|nr:MULTISPECIES: SDR family NAD(P)-dependent oxidoreductase [unclassified Beijerinckia]MDH7796307.1 NAD(P)-dependent dehydrogenase (short-subunit alcohol dehydrogenase family) [Beijerinckia sp. GAS462]SEC39301.1 NAD(P)-dependent dehydrogenase, short-chain alcohol dehydrogenase family [Beijerinckia sp. 28-YEA-48]
MTDLAGRVAIVTGAGKSLGRAYALGLAAQGAAVVVNNRRHPGERTEDTSAAQVVAAIRAQGGRAVANYDEVEQATAGDAMVKAALDSFGRLDIVIANAAVPQAAAFHKTSAEEFRTIFDVGFYGTLHLLQAAWPIMRENGYGRIVTTTSSAGRFGNHGLTAYGAAKGAIESLTRSLAAEGASRGIKANAISPYALSQMTSGYLSGDMAERFSPEQVVPMVLWLASEACTANGEVIIAGGGHFRRGFPVETTSAPGTGKTMADVFDEIRDREGVAYTSSNAAFDGLLKDMNLSAADARKKSAT